MRALEALGRERLSKHFVLRDFLPSEIASIHRTPDIPDDSELATYPMPQVRRAAVLSHAARV